MFKLLKNLRKDEQGATAIEYGLIAALISIAAILAMGALGDSLSGMFDTISGELDTASGGGGSTTSTTP